MLVFIVFMCVCARSTEKLYDMNKLLYLQLLYLDYSTIALFVHNLN